MKMQAQTLCNLDDLAKLLIVDKFIDNVRKINRELSSEFSLKLKSKNLENLYVKYIQTGHIEKTLSQLETIATELNDFYIWNIPYKFWLRNYFKLYLKFFHPESTVKLETCLRYSKENFKGVKVTAAKNIEANAVLKNVFGYYKRISIAKKKLLTAQKLDFSLLTNSRTNDENIFSGSIAFVNHDCHPNVEYITAEKHLVYLKSLTDIKEGEEILVYYGDNYFEENNKNCECVTYVLKNNETSNINLEVSNMERITNNCEIEIL
ncbi:histone-lysine N-methyltransferase KMT5B-like [Phymastichus coffea]|uniref:histone-lysine N-methyltransferase KMT5B-like n=1 Tax=Phymastichus coffea TaxID=108790 RepID=UPI00273A7594|nr:histone-lysine N-methyltransferase KMT5B-like [Phymastichus coffea]